MNLVILCGRLTSDPEVRYSQGERQTAIARFSLAVDRQFKQDNGPTADFINCVSIGRNGEFAEKYLRKGTKVIVTGHWQTGSYTNKDGNKVYTNDCMVDKVEFCESKASNSGNNAATNNTNYDGFMNIPDGIDEELPFS